MIKKVKTILLRVSMAVVLVSVTVTPTRVRADLWGGDVVVLTKILANAIQQLIRLKEIVSTAKDNLSLLRDVNSGIDEAFNLIKTIYPEADLKVYKDWEDFQAAMEKAREIYGHAVNSRDMAAQGDMDQSIVEALLMINKVAKHSKEIDKIGQNIQKRGHGASPKGAARLSAQALGVGLHVQNQSLKTQNAMLKLQAQNSAIDNKKDKEETKLFLQSSDRLEKAMKELKPEFKTPRFK